MKIVVTHGRSQQWQIPRTLGRAWEDALRRGLERAGYAGFDSVPVEFVFYGDIWRPDHVPEDRERGDAFVDSLDEEPTQLEAEVARDLLAGTDAERFPFDALAGVIRGLDDALGVGSLVLAWFLKDLDEYFERESRRREVLDVVRTALAGIEDEIVLVGHSMGSIVAYDYLASRGPHDPSVRDLVTFGSPLGLPSVYRRVGRRAPGTPFPHALDAWLNVYNTEDFATVVRELGPLFPSPDGARRVDDVEAKGRPPGVREPGSGHDPLVYLSSMGLGRGLRNLLEAVPPPSTPPPRAPGRERSPARPGRRAAPPDVERGDRVSVRDVERAALDLDEWVGAEPAGFAEGVAAPASRAAPPAPAAAPAARPAAVAPAARPAPAAIAPSRAAPAPAGPPPAPAQPAPAARPAADTGARTEPSAAANVPTRTIERTASADFPPIVAPGSEHLLVYAIGSHAVYARSATTTMTVPQDARSVALTVGVYAPDFTIRDESGNEQAWAPLELDLERPDAVAKGRFYLRAPATDKRIDTTIYVTFYRAAVPVGQLSLVTAIDPRQEIRVAPIALSLASAPDPDFVLIVTDTSRGSDGSGPFDIRMSREGEYLDRPLGRFPVKQNAWQYARKLLDRFRAVRKVRLAGDRRREAENLGLDLWWALPAEFREFYWAEMHGHEGSIAIYSHEPYIPWELVKPQRVAGGRSDPFLGQAFSIARWKQARTFPDPLVVTGFAVIAPEYSLDPLPAAQDEANDLVERFGATKVAGRGPDVRRLLRSGEVQLIHFAGHGQYDPDRTEESVIKLADGPLLPRDLYRARIGRTMRPLVFLNACEVGERGWTLTQIGGWADAFCDVGFSGFVGPYWAVSDAVGRKAATLFYGQLAQGETVGGAMRAIRRRFDDDDEFTAHPSWLAYTLHCQPNVRVQLPTAQ